METQRNSITIKVQWRVCLDVTANLLTFASSVCTGRLPSLWTCTYTANPLSRSALHTSTHLKHRNTHTLVQQCISLMPIAWLYTKIWRKKWSTCFAELFKALYYILWVRLFWSAKDDTVPVHHKHTHTLQNMMTYLQTSSRGFLWPWWPVGHALHWERKREQNHVSP